jgi:hypothetical protein
MIRRITLLSLVVCCELVGQVNGTTGLPLGGIGTGAVKYNAHDGTFAASYKTPTRNGDYLQLANTYYQLFTKRGSAVVVAETLKAVRVNGVVDDDAIFPLHTVNFGSTNGVSVMMSAYVPFDPPSIAMMCHPCAMFEFTIKNISSDDAVAAVALKMPMVTVPLSVADSGFVSSHPSLQLCALGTSTDGTGIVSYGSDPGFYTDGLCSKIITGTVNRLAFRVSLHAQETKKLRFVLSWYKADDVKQYRYTTVWNSAKAVAVSALANFDRFKANDIALVTRMRASNLPSWLQDQTLNSLANLVNNSVFFQDGRYCHTEGQWEPEGTMDQMWHARQIYTMINPDLAWQELEWWARTQHVQQFAGQIHHDVGTSFNYVGMDDTEHGDYRDISAWVDLNCGFIISVYEAYIATGDKEKLAHFWPYLKNAGQRILTQVQQYGNPDVPYVFATSLSSYDAGGNSQAYNTGLSVVAYRLMSELAVTMGDSPAGTLYTNAFQKSVDGFAASFLDKHFGIGTFCESALAGPWIANFLKLGQLWEKQRLDNLYSTIAYYYDPLTKGLGYPGGSYSEWAPYLVGHLGGYALQTGRPDVWSALQQDMYARNYSDRNLVFNQQLGIPPRITSPITEASNFRGFNQYISIPVLWRTYYDIVGFHHNKASGEIWLEPALITPTVHHMDNALIITPDGYAAMNYSVSGAEYQNQHITFLPDNPMSVTALYVKDLYADSSGSIREVTVDGVRTPFSRIGSGDQAHVKLHWSGTIPPSGITIDAAGDARPRPAGAAVPAGVRGYSLGPSQILLRWQPSPGALSAYIIEMKKGGAYQQAATASANDSSYVDTGLLASTDYTYRIRSFNSQTISDPTPDITISTEPAGSGSVVLALNAGGGAYTSADGIQYLDDAASGFLSGGSTYQSTAAIANTVDDVLYQSERYGDFSYGIPLTNGDYNLVLKFAEIYQDNPGSRIFNVDVEGSREIRELDLLSRTGKNTAYDVVIPVALRDGVLNVKFTTVTDNAKLSAVEIRKRIAAPVLRTDGARHPADYFLSQNYPNPCNPSTSIDFSLAGEAFVKLTVFDALGREVATLVEEPLATGSYSIHFNAAGVNSGTYFYHLSAGKFSQTKKMIVIK